MRPEHYMYRMTLLSLILAGCMYILGKYYVGFTDDFYWVSFVLASYGFIIFIIGLIMTVMHGADSQHSLPKGAALYLAFVAWITALTAAIIYYIAPATLTVMALISTSVIPPIVNGVQQPLQVITYSPFTITASSLGAAIALTFIAKQLNGDEPHNT